MKNNHLYSFLFLISTISFTATGATDCYADNIDNPFIYLGEDLSSIAAFVSKISELDSNYNSPLHQLKKHIEDGFIASEPEIVLQALSYARSVIQNNALNPELSRDALNELETIVNQIADNSLVINSDEITRARLKTLLVKKHLEVLGKSLFHKHMRTKHGIHVQGHLEVDKSSQFHSDVTIDGTLSVTDLAVANCLGSVNEI